MNKRAFYLLLAATLFWTNPVAAQEVILDIQPEYELTIDGTSNIHDWSASATEMKGQLIMEGFDGSITGMSPDQFKSLSFGIPVEDLDSGSRGLNRNLHSNLNERNHPVIRFELNRVTDIVQSGSGAIITATGVVTAAGGSSEITMTVNATTNSEGAIVFSGTQQLEMTSFGIDPPTALLGTVRAKDEFSVIYTVAFNN